MHVVCGTCHPRYVIGMLKLKMVLGRHANCTLHYTVKFTRDVVSTVKQTCLAVVVNDRD